VQQMCTYCTFAARLRRDWLVVANVCQHVSSVETGAGAIEALVSGIPIITTALAEDGLPPARYTDSGIRFTVLLSQPVQPSGTHDQLIYDKLVAGLQTVTDLEALTGLPGYAIRRSPRALRAQGLISQHGESMPLTNVDLDDCIGVLSGSRLRAAVPACSLLGIGHRICARSPALGCA
jgi:hypothetical protein